MDGNHTNSQERKWGKKLRWQLSQPNPTIMAALTSGKRGSSITPEMAIIAAQRFDSLVAAEKFLTPTTYDDFLKKDFPEILSNLKDLESAAERLAEAIINKQSIGISGDYDCDGNCSTALLIRFLMEHDVPSSRIYPHIPNRIEEGYGVNSDAVKDMKAKQVDVLVTLDNGTLAHIPIAEAMKPDANGHKMDVIVADHHPNEVGQALPAEALVVNPNRADDNTAEKVEGVKDLAAVGVTFLLALATMQKLKAKGFYKTHAMPEAKDWLGLVALATIGDVVNVASPINRMLVREGLEIIKQGNDQRISKLIKCALIDSKLDSETIAFSIAPIINAPGRLGQSVAWSFLSDYLFHFESVQGALREKIQSLDNSWGELKVEDKSLAKKWNAAHSQSATDDKVQALMLLSVEANEKRKLLDGEITKLARKQAIELMKENPNRQTLILAGEGWHAGVIGIVASRIKEEFGLPVVVASIDNKGDCKCSARSIKVKDHPVDVGSAFRKLHEQGVLAKAGGHPMAAGASFSANKLGEFRVAFEEMLAEDVKAAKAAQIMPLADMIDLDVIQKTTGAFHQSISNSLSALAALEPVGEGNSKPKVLLRNVRLENVSFSNDAKHAWARINQEGLGGITIKANLWHIGESYFKRTVESSVLGFTNTTQQQSHYYDVVGTFSRAKNNPEIVEFTIEDVYPPKERFAMPPHLKPSGLFSAGLSQSPIPPR